MLLKETATDFLADDVVEILEADGHSVYRLDDSRLAIVDPDEIAYYSRNGGEYVRRGVQLTRRDENDWHVVRFVGNGWIKSEVDLTNVEADTIAAVIVSLVDLEDEGR